MMYVELLAIPKNDKQRKVIQSDFTRIKPLDNRCLNGLAR